MVFNQTAKTQARFPSGLGRAEPCCEEWHNHQRYTYLIVSLGNINFSQCIATACENGQGSLKEKATDAGRKSVHRSSFVLAGATKSFLLSLQSLGTVQNY